MRLLTREQARELDKIAINKMGISGVDLMGQAGAAVADYAKTMVADIQSPKIVVICGKGNNAGDGYKTALDLNNSGFDVQIFALIDKSKISGDSLNYYQECLNNKLSVTHAQNPLNQKYDLIIDAILGTGFKGELKTPIINFTKWINNQSSLVLSIDIPTGVNSNSGIVAQNSIKATATVTMGMVKLGMHIEPGKSHCGKIVPADIGFPNIYKDLPGLKYRLIDDSLAKRYLAPPDKTVHKHRQGKVLIIAGSIGMTGAAILASHGALRSGAGLVATCAPKSLNNIYESNIIEGLTVNCEDDGNGYLGKSNYVEIEKYFDWSDSVLIGPGLGQNPSTMKLVEMIINNYYKPIVIDADGLRYFAQNIEYFNAIKSDFVITPHYGELARLINIITSELKNNIDENIQIFMKGFDGTLVAKNAPTFIASGNNVTVNSTGNQGLATGGTGDVLAGVIASFIAQGIPTNFAAELGVFIHGKAADIVAQSKGFRGLIASDLLDTIPQTIKLYE